MNRPRRAWRPLMAALAAALSLSAGPALAHGGEDHSHDDKPAAGQAAGRSPAPIVNDAAAPQRLPDARRTRGSGRVAF